MKTTPKDIAHSRVAAGIYIVMAERALMRYAELRSQAEFYGAVLDPADYRCRRKSRSSSTKISSWSTPGIYPPRLRTRAQW